MDESEEKKKKKKILSSIKSIWLSKSFVPLGVVLSDSLWNLCNPQSYRKPTEHFYFIEAFHQHKILQWFVNVNTAQGK